MTELPPCYRCHTQPCRCRDGTTAYCGKTEVLLPLLPADSVDAIVTDPPYGLEFMGKAFDTFRGSDFDPAFCYWFSGFTDGEGCFSVHKKHVNGYETYDCQFSITLRADDRPILERIQRHLNIGTLSKPSAHRTNGKDNPKARFSVSAKAELVALRDLFRAFPLRAKKAKDFEIWSEALDAWLHHEPGEWADMKDARQRLMSGRAFVDSGVRIDPFQLWCQRWATAALRVAKPGAHLLAFGGTRTFHRLTCAIEDAGWEIRDCIMWVYGSGFPKGLDVSKAIDKAAGVERERIRGVRSGVVGSTYAQDAWSLEHRDSVLSPDPITDDAKRWQGWGTALKPAWEPIIVARKPLAGTVAANCLEYGTGALNVDGCRISSDTTEMEGRSGTPTRGMFGKLGPDGLWEPNKLGRWPANILHDGSEEVVGLFPETVSGGGNKRSSDPGMWAGKKPLDDVREVDSGSAARFFYCAKADRTERGKGNNHPTVKPLALMSYLCKLVSQPGYVGTLLDPFAGSGSTLLAASRWFERVIGIEQDPKYCDIVVERLRQEVLPFGAGSSPPPA